MGDRTYYTLETRGCADIAFLTALADDLEFHDIDSRVDDTGSWLARAEERTIGDAQNVTETVLAAMRAAGLDFAFRVIECQKYEWQAMTCLYVPGVKDYPFVTVSNDDGHPMIGAREIREAVETTGTRDELVAALRSVAGTEWTDAFKALAEMA